MPDEVHELNAITNRWIKRLAVVALVLFLVLNGITAAGVTWAIFDSRTQSETNGHVLAVVLAVTGCTLQDTPAECQDRFRLNSQAEGTRRIIEVDCVHRRSIAGLPAPDPTMSCVSQTPASVYPGRAR